MGSWAFNPAGFDYWSPELFRMHGLDRPRKPPTVQEYLDFVHPQDRESMADLINGLSAQATPFDRVRVLKVMISGILFFVAYIRAYVIR